MKKQKSFRFSTPGRSALPMPGHWQHFTDSMTESRYSASQARELAREAAARFENGDEPGFFEILDALTRSKSGFSALRAFGDEGICTALLEKLIDEAKSLGLSRVHIHASKMGEPIYRKRGFRELSEVELALRIER